MKTYLTISGLMFLSATILIFNHLSSHLVLPEWIYGDEALGGACGICLFMAFYALCLKFVSYSKERSLKKEKAEISDLVNILKEGREDQLTVLNALKSNATIKRLEESAPEE